MRGIIEDAKGISIGSPANLCECVYVTYVNNQFCKEPGAGKPHAGFCEGHIS